MYDVIVIGAGPAGCTAAKALAEKGFRTLLVEKFKMPRYKSCSGQLIQKTIDLVQTCFGEAVPCSVMCAPTKNKGMIFTNDKGRTSRFEQDGLNVWRSSFDHWLAQKAAQSGAEVIDCTTALSCEEDCGHVNVTLKGSETFAVASRYVINCEGVAGTLKRKLLNDCKPQYITTWQTCNQGSIDLDYHYFHAWLQPELSEYDAWFNVKDHQLVLGVSVKNCSSIAHYYQRFISHMREKHNLQIENQLWTDQWIMPRILPGCPIDYGIGRILFAGEIAGFLNPMGEGISAGIESGYCAANAIIHHYTDPDLIYTEYRKSTNAMHNYMKRQWNLVAEMSETFKEMKL